MRVVSLVPSWTETLIECGVEVVGRTRYCVHPDEAVAYIPIVGGTKDLDIAKVAELKPDLVLVDKEENLPWMAEARGWKVACTHVENAGDLPRELAELSSLMENARLASLAEEWRRVLDRPVAAPRAHIAELPGVLQWLKRPAREPENLIYVIWRGPWMAVSSDTFVGSMLAQVGFGGRLPAFAEKYPKIDLEKFSPENTVLLFSSEPYPFLKKTQELLSLEFPSAIVDGEAYSWFGVRSLRFLQGSARS